MDGKCRNIVNNKKYLYREGWSPEHKWYFVVMNEKTNKKIIVSRDDFNKYYEKIEGGLNDGNDSITRYR